MPGKGRNLMESKAKFVGHPLHPMLIVFPLGLLATAVIFDLIALLWGATNLFTVAYWMIAAGLVGGAASSIFGLIDYLAIPAGTRAKSIGLLHGAGNVLVMILFALSWWMRRAVPDNPSRTALAFSFVAVLLALVTGWLGAELVDRLGVGVDNGANLNAPSSLSRRRADQGRGKSALRRVA
jgi:uncharacterized membrane protein